MTDLRDKIEDVIFDKIYENFGYVCGRDAATDDILNLLRESVKPLEWVKQGGYFYCYKANAKISTNGIGYGVSPLDWPHMGNFEHPTLESAKDSVQEEYNHDVLSAIGLEQ